LAENDFDTGETAIAEAGAMMHVDSGKKKAAFGTPYPGKIIAVDLSGIGHELICRKDAFLCATKGVSIGIAFQNKIGVGLFGGEGFILERLQGDGVVFIHAGGTIIEKELGPREADARVPGR
jgi:uncharacterized protein (AIM24 family)